jgi:Uma2 family endonuclease
MTVEEFEQLPGDPRRKELVQGEVIESMPPGGKHGQVALTLAARLLEWVRRGDPGGYVAVEAGYMLGPDSVRGPDISYVSSSRIPDDGVPLNFWRLAPNLAVEVVSPSEPASVVQAKVRDLLTAGTSLVWVVYPQLREVVAFRPGASGPLFAEDGMLEDEAVLPGFRCPVADLFD